MKMKCKCGATAMIERRYKGHEYRHCRTCNNKYITHEVNDKIIIDKQWIQTKNYKFEKGD